MSRRGDGQSRSTAPRSWAFVRQRRQSIQFVLWWLLWGLVLLFVVCQPRSVSATDLTQAVQAVLDEAQQQYGFPGATAAYVLPNGTMGVAATGMADRETATPMTMRSRMLAASIGKTFVGATAGVNHRFGHSGRTVCLLSKV